MEDGKEKQFERVKSALLGDAPSGGYQTWARDLGVSEDAMKMAVHRLRRRFQRVLREESPDRVDRRRHRERAPLLMAVFRG
jgi:RNA polymerase sigma-70 factor (ECF subfamily)